ncbi:MAG: iron ABC transporter permease [Proteobacteria bacterium]|nr:iron ABC transporter permease [Pseudomonadota bacterium]
MTIIARRWQQHAIIGGVGAVFIVLALLPILWPLIGLLGRESEEVINSLEVFASPRSWVLLARSLGLSCAVVIGALALGTPMGILLARTDVVGRRVMLFAHGFPMFLPPFLLALGWFYLFGRQGYLGAEISAGFLFHPVGHVAILSLAFAPVVTALVVLGLWNLDPSLEEAARVTAGPFRVAKDILLPGIWPSVALGAILVFALSFSELGVPMFLRVDVYPAAVFSRLGGIDYDPGEAFLLALPLVLVALAMVTAEHWFFRERPFDFFGVVHRDMEPLRLGPWRILLSIACWGLTLFSLFPIAALMIKASAGGGFAQTSQWVGRSLQSSLVGSGLAATAIVGIGAVLGHARARALAGSRLLDLVGVLAFVAPAVLLGVGIIAIWNRPSTSFLYNGIGIIVIGYVARYGIIGMRTVAVAVAQSPFSYEQAAAAFGAGFTRRLVSIVLPMHRRTLVAAWLLAAVFCLRDLETAVIYYPPNWQPLTVRIFTLEANGPEAVVAGLAVVQVVITAALLIAGVLGLMRRSEK